MKNGLPALLLIALVSAPMACGSNLTVHDVASDAGSELGEDDATTDRTPDTATDTTTGPGAIDAGSDADEIPAEVDASMTTEPDAAPSEPDATAPPVDPCADQDITPPNPGARKAINDDPAFIQVYNNNIENLKTAGEQCAGDWTDLIHYMKTIEPSPDLFFVQQISNTAQLNLLVNRMSDDLPGVFEGVISEGDPKTQGSPCGPEKALQTNAIIYRKGRFDRVGTKHVWQSWANKNDSCVRNSQARTKNVMIKLHDKIANKDVTAASLHWATSQGGGPDPACALKNVRETDDKIHKAGFEADLVIVAGDLNEPDRNASGSFRPWHREVNGDRDGALNYRDVIYHSCMGRELQTCLDDNWTIGSVRRIDFVFGKDGNDCRAGVRRAHTITFNEGDAAAQQVTGGDNASLSYSDHRAIRAEFYY